MPATRILAKLVTTTGSVSAGAIRTLREEGDAADPALAVIPELLRLVAETICHRPKDDETDCADEVATYLAKLVERYGTARRAIESLATARRRHDGVSTEKSRAWHQVMCVTPGAIEPTMKRHATMLIHVTRWITGHPDLETELERYVDWLDAPLEDLPEYDVPASTIEPDEQAEVELPESTGEETPDIHLIRGSYLNDKHPTEVPGSRTLDPEQEAAVARLRDTEDAYARTIAAVAMRDFVTADQYMSSLEGCVDPHALLTLRADRYYMDSRFDDSLGLLRQAAAIKSDIPTRMNMAICLLHAERGASDENIKEAIDLLTNIIANEADALARARAQAVLGTAWMRNPIGDRDENVRHAIEAFSQGLQPLRHEYSHWWAETNFQLGQAWLELPTGDRAENFQKGMFCFQAALEVWTETEQPHRWATLQNNLGNAWERYPRGNRAHNLEHAIQCFTQAARVHSQSDFPTQWATLQNNVGNAWIKFPEGDPRQNIERGIACHQAALEVWSREDRRSDWAATQTNLGNAWALLPSDGEERARNLRRSISCYKSALGVRTRAATPIAWAATLNNLGSALMLLPCSKRGETFHEAIECFENALEVRTRGAFPLDWAKTQANLGQAWAKRPDGDKSDNLSEAIAFFECALEVISKQSHPHQYRHIAAKLDEAREDYDFLTKA